MPEAAVADAGSGRKLASIVAIDVAGYSRRSETDEAAAIRAVAGLREQVIKAAAGHGGRVFNTAGDGFMLEFPTASGALAAAEEIAAAADPPVRVGVHLGEVSLTQSGDLLGHGVNVAARIQQMASPGAVLVSGDVKRAVRGPLGERLKPQGSVRLDKMSETLPVFALAPAAGGRAKGRRLDLRSPVIMAVVALVLALAGLSLWLGRGAWSNSTPKTTRIAILPFDVLGQASGFRDFADGLREQILDVMSANALQTISRADSEALRGADGSQRVEQLGVTLLLDGAVESDGKTMSVRVHLDDPHQHVTLWTTSLNGPASAAHDLQLRIATEVTNVLLCADRLQRSPSAPRDTDTIALFFHACDLSENLWADAQRSEEELDVLRQVIARAPGFAQGHSRLAYIQAARVRYAFAGQDPALFKEASSEAHRALQIDPNDGDAWLALSLLRPITDYRERERLLVRGLSGATTNVNLLRRYDELLAEVGRMQDGTRFAVRAAAAAPLDSESAASKAQLEAAIGAFPAARLEAAENLRTWPAQPSLWAGAFFISMWSSDWTHAEALLRRPNLATSPEAIHVMTSCVEALRTHEAAKVAAAEREARALGAMDQPSLHWAIQCLGELGLTDSAFELAARYQPEAYGFEGPAVFFYPSTASMRRDRRFMPLMAKLGLVDYWRTTGKWPDFCSEPGLPYDCKAEAAKVRPDPAP